VDHEPNDVRGWYNSYSAGGGLTMYNPWSIMSLCRGKLLKSYWVETGIIILFFMELILFREFRNNQIITMASGYPFPTTSSPSITTPSDSS
jgi:hypothetical protein